MKKILLIAVALMLVPFTAMAAMTAISDTDMAEVTGQAGVTLAPIDFSLDLNIMNIAYTDPDTGVLNVAGIPNLHGGGTFNIHDLRIVNLHETLNGTPIFNDSASLGTLDSTTLVGIQAKAVEIDLVSFGGGTDIANPTKVAGLPIVSLIELRNRTGVVISGADMRLTIDEISLEMTLDDVNSGLSRVSVEWAHNAGVYAALGILDADGYLYTSNPYTGAGLDNSFGDVTIQGLELIMYAYPRIVFSDPTTIGSAVVGTAGMYQEYVAATAHVDAAAAATITGSPVTTGLTKIDGLSIVGLELGDAFNLRHRAQLIISPH